MKIKTSELIGPALDWSVDCVETGTTVDPDDFVMRSADESYSERWDQGGPIIDQMSEDFGLATLHNEKVDGTKIVKLFRKDKGRMYVGPTLLIAAMRCYVASKLGEEVEIPDELVSLP